MKLPHLDNVRVDREKVVDYLLNPEHSEGGSKAVFFASLGFRLADWQVLASALIRHAADNHVARETPTPTEPCMSLRIRYSALTDGHPKCGRFGS